MLEKRVIAFLDVLGFKNIVKNNLEKGLELLNDFRTFDSDFKFAQLTGQQEGSTKIQIEPDFIAFSDHIIISVPLKLEEITSFGKDSVSSVELTESEKIGVLSCGIYNKITQLFINALLKGVAFRGAIAFGDMYYDKASNIVVGTPLIEAIEDEEKCAIYPRVILSQSFMPNDLLFPTRIDFDGGCYLDWLHLLVVSKAGARGDLAFDYLKKIKQIISDQIEQCDSNARVLYKWKWLAHYFDEKIDLWNKGNCDYIIDKFQFDKKNDNFSSFLSD